MAKTIIDRLVADHDEVRELLGRLDDTPVEQRQDLFRDVVEELAHHEAAEQALVHPRTRDTPHGEAIADSVIGEEQEAEELLAEMEDMDPESQDFLDAFRRLRTAVLNHAEHEEEKEFPRLREALDQAELERLADHFEILERLGPTRPHPHAPNTALAQKALGPVAGVFDRARDAVREAVSG